jgi:hypothetical protein
LYDLYVPVAKEGATTCVGYETTHVADTVNIPEIVGATVCVG